MVGTISRRGSLKLALAAGAAWFGSVLLGPFIPKWPLPQPSDYAVPIEGLGLSPSFTEALRAVKITTVGKLVDVLGSNEELQRYRHPFPARDDWKLFEDWNLRKITTRLEVFAKSGPVPFATMTRLEYEVLVLVVKGQSNQAISAELGITRRDVTRQVKSLYRKLRGLYAPYRDGMPW